MKNTRKLGKYYINQHFQSKINQENTRKIPSKTRKNYYRGRQKCKNFYKKMFVRKSIRRNCDIRGQDGKKKKRVEINL